MALTLELITGSDLTLDRDNLTVVRKFRVKGSLPYSGSTDAFDYVASELMGLITSTYPMYDTSMGILFWNSIQLHESYYAQLYEASVTYSPFDKQTGTYQLRIEHAAGMAKATAGVRQAGYAGTIAALDNKGTIWNGEEVVGVDVPYNQTRIVISYRHPKLFISYAYLRAIGALVGHPNNDTFLGYDPGEIAYAGGTATATETEASVEYSFEVSRNVANLVVGETTIAEKKGFDIVSPVFAWGSDATGTTRPIAYVEIIRPAGREWTNYVSVFGWGGA